MVNFKSPGNKKRILSICAALALCLPLILLAQGKQGKGNKGGKSSMCQTVTADAEFRDAVDGMPAGILSDGDGIKFDGKYYGLEDAKVYLLLEGDHDFVLDTRDKLIEKETGLDRKVTLDFLAGGNLNLPPFDPVQEVDALIRVDYVLSEGPYGPVPKCCFLLWFDVGRDRYQLRFDGLDDSDLVSVTQSGESENRIWTIESIYPHKARLAKLKGISRKTTVDYFKMPFKITVTERQDKGPTCL